MPRFVALEKQVNAFVEERDMKDDFPPPLKKGSGPSGMVRCCVVVNSVFAFPFRPVSPALMIEEN